MEPNISRGDFLIIKEVDPEDIKISTIIVFDARECWQEVPETPIVIHRVIEKWKEGNIWYFQTQGDANPLADEEPAPEFCVIGIVWRVIPKLGWINIFIENYNLKIYLIIFVVILWIYSFIKHLIKERIKIIVDIAFLITVSICIFLIFKFAKPIG